MSGLNLHDVFQDFPSLEYMVFVLKGPVEENPPFHHKQYQIAITRAEALLNQSPEQFRALIETRLKRAENEILP